MLMGESSRDCKPGLEILSNENGGVGVKVMVGVFVIVRVRVGDGPKVGVSETVGVIVSVGGKVTVGVLDGRRVAVGGIGVSVCVPVGRGDRVAVRVAGTVRV